MKIVIHSFKYLMIHLNLSHMYFKTKTFVYAIIRVSTLRRFCIKLTVFILTTLLSVNLILFYSLDQGFSRSRHFDILYWKILCPVYYRMFISISCLYTVDARSTFSAVMTIKNVPRYYQTSGARRTKLSHLKTTDLDVFSLLSWKN